MMRTRRNVQIVLWLVWLGGSLLCLGGPGWATSRSGGEWTRRDVRSLGFAVDLPSDWTYEIQGSRLISRDRSPDGGGGLVSVHADRAGMSLDETARSHRDSFLPGSFPNCRIKTDEPREIGPLHGHFFHVTRLSGSQEGKELFDTILRVKGRHVFVSLFFDSGRARDFRDLYAHMVSSVSVRDGAPLPPSQPSRVEERGRRTPPRGKIHWKGSVAGAFAEAKKRNVPVFIVLNMDNEKANNRILKTHYQDEEVVELSRKMVCVIGSIFDHRGFRRGGGGKPNYCPRFGSVYCAEHRDIEVKVRERYLRTPTAIAPQHMFCSPEGELLSRREYMLPRLDLVRMMEGALGAVERKSRLDGIDTAEEFFGLYEKAADVEERRGVVGDVLYFGDVELGIEFFGLIAKGEAGGAAGLEEALESVRHSRHPDGSLYCEGFLEHTSEKVRELAARALAATADGRVLDRIRDRTRKERSTLVKGLLIQALGAAAAEDGRVADLLIRYSKSGPKSQKINAVLALRHFPENKKVAEAVLKAFRSGRGDEVKSAAALVLGVFRIQGAEPLLEKWGEDKFGTPQAEIVRWALECIRGDREPSDGFDALATGLVTE